MTAPRTPEQRARFVRSVASELDVAPELAERLLFLSEASRRHVRSGGRTEPGTVRRLLDCLLDDEVCRHAWCVVEPGDTGLWRQLLAVARPPRDVGPAMLLAFAAARGDAVDEALDVLAGVIRPAEFRRSAIELAADLAEDAGQAALAWSYVVRLGVGGRDADRDALRCVLGCSPQGPCDRAQLAGAAHARWLRHRIARWVRRPWSGTAEPYDAVEAGYLAARRFVVPAGERELLGRWVDVSPEDVTVLETSRWRAILNGPDGLRRTAGWESAAPPDAAPGATLRCRLLPTLVPGEHLAVRATLPPPW